MAARCGHLRLLRQSWAPTLVGATAGVHHHHPALAEGWHGGTGHMEANDSGRTPGCAAHPSHDGAKLPFDLAMTIPRDCLRPQHGDGFLGAPLLLCRPSKMRWPDHGGADATAQDKSPNPQGPGEP